jgi:methylmalonyl-CoA mutase N-terminal domain/subunit
VEDRFRTVSGRPVSRVYTPTDTAGIDYEQDIGDPGVFPYTRGIHASRSRDTPWTLRQSAGFGTPAQTNRRYRELLAVGQSSLSVAFDRPTLIGRDPDHPAASAEVGRSGVSVSTVPDMAALFDGIPLQGVATSMTINAPAAMIFAMYLVLAERQGVEWTALAGTLQNDILEDYIAQTRCIFPLRPSMRLVTDVCAFASIHVPKWNTIAVSGYGMREAGATAVQELAFTLAGGLEYVAAGIAAGVRPETFVPRVSFFFSAQSDFFEEIAKYRAARRIWARLMAERFGLTDGRCLELRFHTQTAGASLTAAEPLNNIVRTTLQALSAVLGGTNSLHTNALDHTLGPPTTEAAALALRTQQVLAHENGLASIVDPLGGSWFIERLTSEFESDVSEYFRRIDARGGMIAAIEAGFPQREIADAARRHQHGVESGARPVIGVNVHADDTAARAPAFAIDTTTVRSQQIARVRAVREARDSGRVSSALAALQRAARGSDPLMPVIIDAVRADATLGELCDALRAAWGESAETASIW